MSENERFHHVRNWFIWRGNKKKISPVRLGENPSLCVLDRPSGAKLSR